MKRAILFLFFPLLTVGEPGPVTSYLINEPASLMDIGLMKAKAHFQMADKLIESDYKESDPILLFSSNFKYEFADDLFFLDLSLILSHDKIIRCRDLMQRYGNILNNLMTQWFSHKEYDRDSLPDDFESQLLKRVVVRCNTPSFSARRKLLDDKIDWTMHDND